jgi:PKD repeat protein
MRRLLYLSTVLVALALCLPGAAAATRLYAPLYATTPPAVEVLDNGTGGALTPLAGQPFATQAGPPYMLEGTGNMAFAPDGARAAISFFFSPGIQALTVAPDGSVSPAGAPIAQPTGGGLAVSPDGRFAYVANRPAGIRAYSFGSDGTLKPIAGSPFGSQEVGDIAMTPDGRFLYATTAGNLVACFEVSPDGRLAPLGTTSVPSPGTIEVSPDGRFLFVGKEMGGDGVISFSIGADGSLTQNGEPALTGDVAMGYFTISSDGSHVYMPDSNVDGIVTAAVAADGRLSVVGTTKIEDPGAAVVSPDGHFLYWNQRGGSGHIGAASIGADGIPVLIPGTALWNSGERERMLIQPQPAPTASFTAKPAAPGSESRFDAGVSTRAVRYDWDFGDGTTLVDGGATPSHRYATAGVYDVELTVTDAQGCSVRKIYTGQSTECPGGSAATTTAKLDTPPAITALSVSRKKTKSGTVFRYKLTEKAKVRFKIERRKGKRFKKAGPPLNAKGKAGKNKLKFSGRLKGKALKPGSYRVTAVATDSSGGRSAPRSVSFHVVG